MKNLFTLLFALAFTAGMAYGQNNQSSVNQSGTAGHDAYVTQTYTAGAPNVVLINQAGNVGDHLATAVQNGGNNLAKLDQDGSDNTGSTNQEGKNHVAWIIQTDGASSNNSSTIDQNGENNTATTTQVGTGNIASINQFGDAFAPTAVLATIVQKGLSNQAYIDQSAGEVNNTYINQDGDNNIASVLQKRNQGYSEVFQNGTGNEAYVTMYAGKDITSSTSVKQTGTSHYAIQTMGSAPLPMDGTNYQTIVQNGADNDARQYMNASAGGAFVDSNNAQVITQSDSNNFGQQWMGSTAPGIDVDNNSASLTQTGTGHQSWQSQYDSNNSSIVTQSGSGMVSNVTQYGN